MSPLSWPASLVCMHHHAFWQSANLTCSCRAQSHALNGAETGECWVSCSAFLRCTQPHHLRYPVVLTDSCQSQLLFPSWSGQLLPTVTASVLGMSACIESLCMHFKHTTARPKPCWVSALIMGKCHNAWSCKTCVHQSHMVLLVCRSGTGGCSLYPAHLLCLHLCQLPLWGIHSSHHQGWQPCWGQQTP